MNPDLQILIPFIILAASVVLLLLLISFYRNHALVAIIASLSFLLSLASLYIVSPAETFLFAMNGYTLFFTGMFMIASFAITVLSFTYFRYRGKRIHEFYILLITAALGSSIMAASSHFISFFLGIEILSVSLYVLISYLRDSASNIEAGIKYLILTSASSAFMLFGMALVYFETGTMSFTEISQKLASPASPLFYAAFALILTGFGFKLAVVPFHLWTPDVYEGAPAPVTAFIATISKGAVFVVLFRFVLALDLYRFNSLMVIFYIISIASMFTGNLLALGQNNLKRMLAYSSIAHLGYLLVTLITGGEKAPETGAFYLAAYFMTTITAFGIITSVSDEDDVDCLERYKGLFWYRPFTGAFFTAALLSLAGIPLTAGFIGKFYIAYTGIASREWLLVIILVINSAISLYYYLKVVIVLFEKPEEKTIQDIAIPAGIVLAVLTALVIFTGLFPQFLIDVIRNSITG